MRKRLASWLVRGVVSGTLVALAAGPALARSEKTVAYTREQVWPTAVRFLVVDERLEITDRDADAGYVLFELVDDGKRFRGSLEVLTVVRDKRTSVRFVLHIEDRPDWIEIAMLNRLERKLRAELGAPARPRPSDPPAGDPPAGDPPASDPPAKEPPRGASPDDGGPPISPTP